MALDLETFRRELRWTAEGTVEALMEDLVAVRAIDARAERKRRFWTVLAIVTLIPALLIGLFGFLSCPGGAAQPNAPFFIAIAVAVILFAFSMTAFSMARRAGRLDLDNRRYELVGKLARALGTDAKSSSPMRVDVDFTPPNVLSKKVREDHVAGWNVQFYVDPWLDLSAQLGDGTRVRVVVLEKRRDKDRTSTSASGKIKHKHKWKSSAVVAVRLRVKEKRYPGWQARKVTKLPLPEGAQLRSLKWEGDEISVAAKLPWGPLPSHGELDAFDCAARMLQQTYAILDRVRAESRTEKVA